MPRINIYEVDETSGGSQNISTDVVYIPGFVADPTLAQNAPVLCRTLTEFETLFGDEPFRFSDGVTLPFSVSGTTTQVAVVNKGDCDKSYLMARELLNRGFTVMYDTIHKEGSSQGTATREFIRTLDADTSGFTTDILWSDLISAEISVAFEGSTATKSENKEGNSFTVTASANSVSASVTVSKSGDYVSLSNITALQSGIIKSITVKVVYATEDAGYAPASLDYFYANVAERIDKLIDRGEYTIKFITTGGYPAFEYETGSVNLAKEMLTVAAIRGDAVAIIDHCNIPDRALTGDGSVYKAVNSFVASNYNTADSVYIGTNGDVTLADGAEIKGLTIVNNTVPQYSAMFTPWASYALNVPDDWYPTDESTSKSINEFALPASFAYFNSMAESNKTNPDWLAIAGVTRGLVPQIKRLLTTERLSNTIANSYQPKGDEGGDVAVAINAITNIRPYGLTIWGNRTLKNNALKNGLTATSFLNTRNMVSDVKKVCYTTAKALMFEQNSNVLWLSFKAGIIPLLDQLKSGNGISGYKILQQPTTEKAKLAAIIKLYPVYAVEEFDITIVLSDEDVTVA